jgi:hypothetical protein
VTTVNTNVGRTGKLIADAPPKGYDGYDGGTFTAWFAEHMVQQDYANFKRSLAPQAQMFWDYAIQTQLQNLAAIQHQRMNGMGQPGRAKPTKMLLRLQTDQLKRSVTRLQQEFGQKQMWSGGNIVGVFIGNEQDASHDWRWRLPDGTAPAWGNQPEKAGAPSPMQHWALDVAHVADALSAFPGVALISPAWIMRGFSPDDAPDPGLYTAREIVQPVWYGANSPISGNGVHYYDFGWWERDPPRPELQDSQAQANGDYLDTYKRSELESYIQRLVGARVATAYNVDNWKQSVRMWSGYHHHQIYVDETNTYRSSMSAVEHMVSCVGKSKLLIHSVNSQGYRLGERVAMFSPFVWNGLGNAYPRQYIMNDPACMEIVRQHLIEEGFVE